MVRDDEASRVDSRPRGGSASPASSHHGTPREDEPENATPTPAVRGRGGSGSWYEPEEAAVKLQAQARRMHANKKVSRRRKLLVRKQARRSQERAAATKIQSVHRMKATCLAMVGAASAVLSPSAPNSPNPLTGSHAAYGKAAQEEVEAKRRVAAHRAARGASPVPRLDRSWIPTAQPSPRGAQEAAEYARWKREAILASQVSPNPNPNPNRDCRSLPPR